MTGYFKYAVVFKTTILSNQSEKIILDPVRVEIFEGERTYKIPHQPLRVLPIGEGGNISRDVSLKLPTGHYIEFIARTKEERPDIAQEFCEQEINKVITILSITYSSDIFDKLVFSGWILEDKGIMSAWIKMANKLTIDGKETDKQVTTITKYQLEDKDANDRFFLMSRFYVKSLLYDPGEEKFLFLWTILEIFPMENTTDIKPISIYLSKITRKSAEEVKEKLGIGKIYGLRSDLVHNGEFKVDLEVRGKFISKMEDIVNVILREMAGLPYDGRLDKYFS